MIDKIAEWAWNMPSIDEYWDDILSKSNDSHIDEIICNLPDGQLKDYLILKIEFGIGKPIIKRHTLNANGKARNVYCDIRDFETYVKYVQKYK